MNEQNINEFLSDADKVLDKIKKGVLPNSDKTNLYVFGQPHNNLIKIISEAFSVASVDNIDGFFVKGCECDILYGDELKVYQTEGSEKKEIDFSHMKDLLSQFDNTGTPLKFEIITNSEAVSKFNIHLVMSDNDYKETDWDDVLKNADYIFFTLTATALLSMCERKILRTHLLPNIENNMGILLTNNNMILSSDKESIESSLNKMFGNSQTPVFRFPESDKKALAEHLNGLPEKIEELQCHRKNRCKKIEINKLLQDLETQLNVLSADNAQLDDVIELLNEKLKKLPERKESAFRRARMKYTSKLRIELTESVSCFRQQFDETIEKEIASNDNIEELQTILPDYIRSQWANKAAELNNRVNRFAEAVSDSIIDYINDDITSYIEEGVSDDFAEYVFGLTKMYLQKQPGNINPDMQSQSFDYELKKDNSKLKKYGVIASGVALAMMSHPIVGIAVAVLGSKKVAKDDRKRFIESGKGTLLDASKKMCIDFHNEMDSWIEKAAKNIENHLETCIGECYRKVIDMMLEAVKAKQHDLSDHETEIRALNELKEKIENEIK